MPWPCVMYERCTEKPTFFRKSGDSEFEIYYSQLPIGAMWCDDDELCVIVPRIAHDSLSKQEWNIDRGRNLNAQKAGRNFPQWTWTGEPPNVTATPSINCVGTYHGHLTNGVLTDDCEGRRFK